MKAPALIIFLNVLFFVKTNFVVQVNNVTREESMDDSSFKDVGFPEPRYSTTIAPTTTSVPTNKPPETTTEKPAPTTSTSTTTTIKPPPTTIPTSSTTKSPSTTAGPSSTTTPENTTQSPREREFDGPSFFGGIILAIGLTGLGGLGYKFYKTRTERNYHTL